MHKLNCIGPSTDPCMTPHSKYTKLLVLSAYFYNLIPTSEVHIKEYVEWISKTKALHLRYHKPATNSADRIFV